MPDPRHPNTKFDLRWASSAAGTKTKIFHETESQSADAEAVQRSLDYLRSIGPMGAGMEERLRQFWPQLWQPSSDHEEHWEIWEDSAAMTIFPTYYGEEIDAWFRYMWISGWRIDQCKVKGSRVEWPSVTIHPRLGLMHDNLLNRAAWATKIWEGQNHIASCDSDSPDWEDVLRELDGLRLLPDHNTRAWLAALDVQLTQTDEGIRHWKCCLRDGLGHGLLVLEMSPSPASSEAYLQLTKDSYLPGQDTPTQRSRCSWTPFEPLSGPPTWNLFADEDVGIHLEGHTFPTRLRVDDGCEASHKLLEANGLPANLFRRPKQKGAID